MSGQAHRAGRVPSETVADVEEFNDPAAVAARFEALDVLQRGHFRLSSGAHSDTYLQLARALQHPAVAVALGDALARRCRGLDADVVASPALGGVLAGFAVALAADLRFVFAERTGDRGAGKGELSFRRGQGPEAGERVLVVEDVVTTGGSAREVASRCAALGADVVGYAAIVDRSAGVAVEERPPEPPVALLDVRPETWSPDGCPLCARGAPLDTPGSRR